MVPLAQMPKVLHQTWRREQLLPKHQAFYDSWEQCLPKEWHHVLWTDADIDAFVEVEIFYTRTSPIAYHGLECFLGIYATLVSAHTAVVSLLHSESRRLSVVSSAPSFRMCHTRPHSNGRAGTFCFQESVDSMLIWTMNANQPQTSRRWLQAARSTLQRRAAIRPISTKMLA